jgi:hypothetical protein
VLVRVVTAVPPERVERQVALVKPETAALRAIAMQEQAALRARQDLPEIPTVAPAALRVTPESVAIPTLVAVVLQVAALATAAMRAASALEVTLVLQVTSALQVQQARPVARQAARRPRVAAAKQAVVLRATQAKPVRPRPMTTKP